MDVARQPGLMRRGTRWYLRAKAPRTSFHSFPHNFRDALREADGSRDVVLALGGWSAGGTKEIYGGGLRPSTLARAMAQIHYPGLDLSYLQTG
jgi:integrase